MMGFYHPGGWMPHMTSGFGLFGGWSVIVVGIGVLAVIGLVLWLAFSPRHAGTDSQGSASAAGVYPVAVQAPSAGAPGATDPAEAIVRERFARGEIDREEFDRTIATLRTTR